MTFGPCGKQLAARPVPMVRKRPAAAMGGQAPASLGPVWKWRCEVGHQASQLGVEVPSRYGARVEVPELAEALQPGTVQATASNVDPEKSKRKFKWTFWMPPHCSHTAKYEIYGQVLKATVSVFGPNDPATGQGSRPAPADDQGRTGGGSGGEPPRASRKRQAAAR